MKRALVPLVVGAGVYLYLLEARGYPWQLASLTALALSALTWSTRSSLERRWWVERRWEIGGNPVESEPEDPANEPPPSGKRLQ